MMITTTAAARALKLLVCKSKVMLAAEGCRPDHQRLRADGAVCVDLGAEQDHYRDPQADAGSCAGGASDTATQGGGGDKDQQPQQHQQVQPAEDCQRKAFKEVDGIAIGEHLRRPGMPQCTPGPGQ